MRVRFFHRRDRLPSKIGVSSKFVLRRASAISRLGCDTDLRQVVLACAILLTWRSGHYGTSATSLAVKETDLPLSPVEASLARRPRSTARGRTWRSVACLRLGCALGVGRDLANLPVSSHPNSHRATTSKHNHAAFEQGLGSDPPSARALVDPRLVSFLVYREAFATARTSLEGSLRKASWRKETSDTIVSTKAKSRDAAADGVATASWRQQVRYPA
jgi:hypothetical protein